MGLEMIGKLRPDANLQYLFEGEQKAKGRKRKFDGIEFLFRDAKQHLGFEDCQARNEKALDFHFNVSLSALNLAKAEALRDHTAGQTFVFSMQSQKCLAFNEHLMDCFISRFELNRTLIKSHPAFNELRKYGAIAS